MWRELRLAALADAPDAFGSTLAAEQDYDEATWRDLLHPARGLRAVAFAPDPVGIVGAHHSTEVPGMVKLTGMWVRPTAKGTGVAELLVREVIRWAREQGRSTIGLYVSEGNARARRLYERLAFVDDATAPVRCTATGKPCHGMVLTLETGDSG